MDILIIVLIGVILIISGILSISILIKVGKIILSILLHMLFGVILLFIFNLLPFFKIPIKILTILMAGFGGLIELGLLIVTNALGFY
jgi:inhibitor of the pro-sigma K processing machinery